MSITRVYHEEWVVMRAWIPLGPPVGLPVDSEHARRRSGELFAEAWEFYQQHYAGRVHPEHARVARDEQDAEYPEVRLELKLPVIKGEFSNAEQADTFGRATFHDDYEVVEKDSADDHARRGYGVRMLPGEQR